MAEPDYSLRLAPSFVDGVLLSAGAVADAYLIYAGGACVNERMHQVYLAHDYAQNLLEAGATPRLIPTFTDDAMVPLGAVKVIEQTPAQLQSKVEPGVILLAELSMVTIAGDDLESVATSLRPSTSAPVVAAATPRLTRDHSDAFRVILKGLAQQLPDAAFSGGTVEDRVAVIGYFCERGEGDHIGNILEMARSLKSLDLEPTAPWLCGGCDADLAAAARASVLLALPSGRQAAQSLAARSGATVLDIDLPVGFTGTSQWLRTVAAACGREEKAEAFIGQELAEAVPRLDWVVSRHLAGRRIALNLLMDWHQPVNTMVTDDFGMDVVASLVRNRGEEGGDSLEENSDPSVRLLNQQISQVIDRAGLDVIVGSTWERNALHEGAARLPFVEFGYPMLDRHFLAPTPHLGYRGVLTWADRFTAALQKAE